MKTLLSIILLCLPAAAEQRATYDIGVKYRIDAGQAAITRPVRTGTGSPNGRDACSGAGEMYFQTDAAPGSSIWGCTTAGAANTAVWTLQGGGTAITRTITAGFINGGSALSAGTMFPKYAVCTTMASAGTFQAYTIQVDVGAATFKLWKNSNSSALPTAGDSISTSGFSISGATRAHSTTLTDLSSTSFSAGDNVCVQLAAVSGGTTDAKLILEYQ